jgi:enoyl-CoA hydratase/carnithine racemase
VNDRATLRLWHAGTTVTLPDDPLACVQDGPIVHVVINRPAKRNAITLQIWRDMAAAMERLAADPAVKLLVLRGAGTQAFSPGADIQEFPRCSAMPRAHAPTTPRYAPGRSRWSA